MAVSEKAMTGKRPKWNESNTEPLIALYESGKTLQEVGDANNLSRERVRQIFKSIGYETRRFTSTERRKKRLAEAGKARRIDLPKEELERLYWKEKLTIKEIAKHLGVNDGTVYQNFIRHGIPTRSRYEIAALIPAKHPGLTREKLYRLYIEENKSQREIGELFGCAPITIAKQAAEYGFRKVTGEEYEKRYGRFGKKL